MEMLDVLNENGEFTGIAKSRKEVHEKGLWHRCAHIWILNSKNEVLLQKRSAQKETHPGKWDISVAGHVSAGQTGIEGAQREIKEEIGIDTDRSEITLLGSIKAQNTLKNGTYINNQINEIYVFKKDLDMSKIKLQTEEVEEIKWIPIQKLKDMVASNDPSLVEHPTEFPLLFKHI